MERVETMNVTRSSTTSSGTAHHSASSTIPQQQQQKEASSSSSSSSTTTATSTATTTATATTRPGKIVLTPAQAAAEASSKNPSHRYNIQNTNKKVATAYENGGENIEHKNNNNNNNNESTTTTTTTPFFERWFDKCIDLVAYVVTRVLNHPDVRDAASSAILEGMIKVCYVENLHDHLKYVDETLTKYLESDAAKKGKDTQKIVKAYLGGIFAKINDDDDDDNNNNDNNDSDNNDSDNNDSDSDNNNDSDNNSENSKKKDA